MKRICVFCGSNSGANPLYAQTAAAVGAFLAQNEIELVYGGGRVGLMGVVADSVLQNGGRATGVIPRQLDTREVAHAGLSELFVVKSMHERKALMADLANGFVALPGGFGTFEEFCEIVTWAQLGIHQKPCALLNVNGFYDSLIGMINHSMNENFIRPEHRALVLVDDRIENLYQKMKNYQPPVLEKWLDETST
jgi:uncharacterized protein (TIGR00730 family)